MPTTDIIGYVWHNRQDLDLDGLPDVLHFIADLQQSGLECARVETIKILGRPAGVSVQLVRKTPEEWQPLVEHAIMQSAIENTIDMIHEESDRA